jgi:hypothetical protein
LATKSFRLFGGKCSLERSWHTFLPPADVMLLDVLLLSVWYLPISLLFVLYKCFIFLDKIICCSTQHLFWDTSDVHFPISQKHSFMQQQKEHLRHPGLRLVKLLGLPTKLTIFAASFCQFLVFFRCPEGYPGWKKNATTEARLGPPDSLPATDCCRAFGASDTTHDPHTMTCQTYQIETDFLANLWWLWDQIIKYHQI